MSPRVLAYGEAALDVAALTLIAWGFHWLGIFSRPTPGSMAMVVAVSALIGVHKLKRGVRP